LRRNVEEATSSAGSCGGDGTVCVLVVMLRD
jgi:hypothetical protein